MTRPTERGLDAQQVAEIIRRARTNLINAQASVESAGLDPKLAHWLRGELADVAFRVAQLASEALLRREQLAALLVEFRGSAPEELRP